MNSAPMPSLADSRHGKRRPRALSPTIVSMSVRPQRNSPNQKTRPICHYDESLIHLRQQSATCPDAPSYGSRFTGKERDSESGNDYFGARYYASSMGRFMSPDWSAKQEPVPYAKLDNPQSLNLYAYVLNNPLDKTDPDGHDFWDKVLNKIQGKGWVDTPRPQLASAPKAPGPVGIVNYHGHTVTNPTVKQKLTEISIQHASSTVNVSSGDRDFVPTGGSKTSAHLDGNAADFHVQGFTDSQVDANLKSSDSPVKTGFNVIQHGPDTATEGAHVHIDTENHGGASAPTSFKHEGMSPETTGHYSVDPQ